jgi:hypothetical protein
MEALKSHPVKSKGWDIDKHGFMLDDPDPDCLDTIFLDRLDEFEQKLATPNKIHKPKHTPPFWANNWRKK